MWLLKEEELDFHSASEKHNSDRRLSCILFNGFVKG
jgi:hypothetical protein